MQENHNFLTQYENLLLENEAHVHQVIERDQKIENKKNFFWTI